MYEQFVIGTVRFDCTIKFVPVPCLCLHASSSSDRKKKTIHKALTGYHGPGGQLSTSKCVKVKAGAREGEAVLSSLAG